MSHNYRGLSLELARRVLPQYAREYAKSRGWQRVDTKRAAVAVYAVPVAGRYEEVVIPADPAIDDYPRRIIDSVLNLAEFESRQPMELLEDLLQAEADTLRFILDDTATAEGSLPVSAGLDLVEGVRRSLLAAACSTVDPGRRFHPRMSGAEADQFVKACRLKPAERGSFVIAVVCPLRAVDTGAMLMDVVEPFTRRVTSLLMQSVGEIVDAVEKDEVATLYGEPEPGKPAITANLCEALLRMRPEPGGMLKVAASWAPMLPLKAASVPQVVRLRAEYFDQVSDVYERLRPTEVPKAGMYVGTVETLNGAIGEDGQRSGEATLQVLVENELAKTRVDLDAAQYRAADEAHMSGELVGVLGKLHRGRRVHRIAEIEKFWLLQQSS